MAEAETGDGVAAGAAGAAGEGATKQVEKTQTRACYACSVPGLEGRLRDGRDLRDLLDCEVGAVSTAMRNGSRFLELQLRLLLQNGGAAFPPAFDWKTASRQACASMQKNARPRITTPGYDAADAIWQQQHPRSVHGVELPVLSSNSLT